ncbi:MAG: dihydrofolate reductase [Candidatus Andersenbacteria bacterium]|nr:dihydrofolate reductase [Candidatus Andersenbacteria bacterium]
MTTSPTIHMIVAMTRDRVIGKRGSLPWKLKGDLPRFRRLTLGKVVIMGRRTYDSIGRPLPGRHNIVLDYERQPLPGVTVCGSVEEALALARALSTDIFVIGGASVYAQMLPLVEWLHISHVRHDYSGDVYFPLYEPRDWEKVASEEYDDFTAATYRRVRTNHAVRN